MIASIKLNKSKAMSNIHRVENKVIDRLKRVTPYEEQTKHSYYGDIEIFIYSKIAQRLMKHCNVKPVHDTPYRWYEISWKQSKFIPSTAKRIPFIGIPRNQIEPQDMLDKKYFNLIYKVQLEAVWFGIKDFLRVDESDWDEYEIQRMFNPLKVTYDSNRRYRCLPLREEKKTEKTKAQVDWYNNFMMSKQDKINAV